MLARTQEPTGEVGHAADGPARLRHDLRQSLAAVQALLSVVKTDPHLSIDADQRLGLVQAEIDWMADLLMAAGDGEEAPLELVDVGAVVEDAWASVAASAACPVELQRDPAVHALTDPVGLRRSARNLIENAVRAAGCDGRVEVRVRVAGQNALVEVADDGPGFGLVPRQQGLGLMTVQRFLTRVGGSIAVSRSTSGGSLLTVSLPRQVRRLTAPRGPA